MKTRDRFIVTFILIFLITMTESHAQTKNKIFPFPVNEFELENGLKVVSVSYDSPGIIAYYTVVRAGSRNEVEKGFSGYAHFFEHMMFRGTDRFSSEEYNDVLKKMGADSNAFTTDDWTAYHIVASSDALEKIINIESDRFLNLEYSEEDFKTEAGAILGEYNLNFSNPFLFLRETVKGLAYSNHPYQHTTIGLLEDIKNMPENYEYSLQFYDRYYRPENSVIVVVGDFRQNELERLIASYYGNWEQGKFIPEIPKEPVQAEEKSVHKEWPNETVPYLYIGYHVAAFSDQTIDMPALDVISQLLFSRNAPLFQKLYVDEQVVDILSGGAVDHRDSPLFEIAVRVTKPDKMDYVRDEIFKAIDLLKSEQIDAQTLEDTKAHMRYSFAMQLNNPNAIARTLGHYLQLTGDPETVNNIYELYDSVTQDDIVTVVRRYFSSDNRTTVLMTGQDE